MGTCYDLCRLCMCNLTEKGGETRNIFKQPKKILTFANDILSLLDIEIPEKPLWPSNACMDCIRQIDQIKSFKMKITTTQHMLGKSTTLEEVLIPMEDQIVEAETVPIKTELKIEEFPDPPVNPVVLDNPLEQPTGRTTRSGRSRDFVVPPTKAKPKPAKNGKEDDDWDPHPLSEKKKKEKKEADKRSSAIKTRIELQFRVPLELEKTLKSLNLLECVQCKASLDTFYEFCCHMESQHKISRQHAYVICCNKRHGLYTVYDHARYHLNNEAFQCSICEKICKSGQEKKYHDLRHLPESQRKHKCTICDRGFNLSQDLRKHLQDHAANPVNCERCKKMFPTNQALEDHIGFDHEKMPRHICEICGKGYNNAQSFYSHTQHHLNPPVRAVQQCDVCQLFFRDVQGHKERSHGDNKLVPCPKCGKKYSPKYLRRHMERVHPEENATMFTCSICDKQFRMKQNLQKHMNIHLGIRFQCFFCDETYGEISNRLKHLQRKHKVEYEEYKRNINFQKTAKYKVKTGTEDPVQSVETGSTVQLAVLPGDAVAGRIPIDLEYEADDLLS